MRGGCISRTNTVESHAQKWSEEDLAEHVGGLYHAPSGVLRASDGSDSEAFLSLVASAPDDPIRAPA